jgi:hypothetical protein
VPEHRSHIYRWTFPVYCLFPAAILVVDHCSCCPEAFSLARTSTTAALSSGRVARFGVPAVINSNRGVPFASLLWAALCALLSVRPKQCLYTPVQ